MNTTPKHKLGIAMQHMLEQGKRPCFRIDGLRITIASEVSVNPGSLYIKNDNWEYIGKISPDGFMKIMHPSLITAKQKMQVMAAIHSPEETAMTNGKVTGTCCCCGRQLTNPLSIELGIGPICRGFWFPESTSPVDTVAMLETLDNINQGQDNLIEKETGIELTDSLELDLGLPPVTKVQVCFKHPNIADANCPDCVQDAVNCLASLPTPPTPVAKLVLGYCDLMHDDQMKFLATIQEIESNASN